MSRLHANTSIPGVYWRKLPNRRAHLESWHPESYKTNRTWENFNNWGTKMILLSDQVWLIANNAQRFANSSKSIINNLSFCKHPEIYLTYNFQYIFGKERYIKQINDIRELQKKRRNFADRQRKTLSEI